MIFRLEQLGNHPSVFWARAGLTMDAFDHLLPELLAVFASNRHHRLDCPSRRRAVGGDDFDLPVAD
jgi:hypothetical protein